MGVIDVVDGKAVVSEAAGVELPVSARAYCKVESATRDLRRIRVMVNDFYRMR